MQACLLFQIDASNSPAANIWNMGVTKHAIYPQTNGYSYYFSISYYHQNTGNPNVLSVLRIQNFKFKKVIKSYMFQNKTTYK